MTHPLPLTGSPVLPPNGRRAAATRLLSWRPALAAALSLLASTGAQAQHRAWARPLAAERIARPLTGAAAVLPANTVRARQVLAPVSSTATGGNWSDAATWVGGAVPTAADAVTIVGGATVTLDVAATCGSLAIQSGGALQTSATTAYQLQVAGDVTNDGVLDLSASTTIGSELRFTGAGSAAFAGTGTTDLQTLTLAKAVRADVVDMNLPSLSVKGSTTTGDGFLLTRTTGATPVDDMTGTLKISGTATLSNKVFGNAAGYIIPATGGFWLNSADFTVTAQNGTAAVNGLLRLTAGTYNVGTAAGNSLTLGTGSVLTVEGGTLSAAGRVTSFTSATAAAVTAFTLTGGTINVSTVGNASGTPSFGINGATVISGGTINLVQRSTAATPLDYYVAGTYTFTGGTVNVGTAATATNFDFRIRGSVPNLIIDNTTNAKSAVLQGQTNSFGNVVITPGGGLNLNGALLLQFGTALTNNGTLTGTVANSTLYFAGSAPQTLGGAGTFTTVRTLTADNSGGGVTLNVPLTVTRVNLFTGNINGAGNLTIGDGSAAFFVIQVGVTGNPGTSGSIASAPVFNIGSGALQLIYAPETTVRTTGFEVPATRRADVVSIANPAGVILAGGNLLIPGVTNASLFLTSGILTTSAANTVIIGAQAGAIPTGSATSYVKGPLGITVNSATAVARTFAVGDAAGWRPVVVTGITASTDQTFTATVVSGGTGGTGAAPVTNLNPTRYVRLENSANLPATARVQLSYGADDVLGNAATAVVAQAATAAGAYASLGGAPATTPTTGIASTADLTPGNDFFVLANTEGGALTSSVAAVCAGTNSGTLTLAGSAGTIVNYQADSGAGFADVPGTNTGTTLAFANLTATTTFRAVIMTADGRTVYSSTVTVTVNPAPTATLTASTPTTFCGSGTLTLTAAAGTGNTYQYQLNGADIAGATSATYSATVSASGSYTVVVTNASGCAATSAPVAVTVNPATTATFAYSGSTYCASGTNPTPTVTGTAGGTFSSTTGLSIDATTGAINLAASTLGTYTVTYSVAGTCPSSATATITVTSAPLAGFSYASAAYCAGGATNPAPVFATGASAGSFSASAAGLVINAATGVINLSASTAGTYTVTNNINASGGCSAATATASVTINAGPTAALTTTTPTTFCQGGAVVLTATGGGTYQFLLNGAPIAGATSATYSATASGAYSVVVTNAGGCSATSAATTVVVNAVPATPTLSVTYNGPTTTLTSSAATGNQFFRNGVAISGATAQTYVVNSGAQLGSYTVTTTNAAGCTSAASSPIVVTSSVRPLAGTSLSVYPNPTHDGRLSVELTGYHKAVELTVLNALGQVVFTALVPASASSSTQAVNLTQLASGVYVLRAKTEGGLDTRRVVKD